MKYHVWPGALHEGADGRGVGEVRRKPRDRRSARDWGTARGRQHRSARSDQPVTEMRRDESAPASDEYTNVPPIGCGSAACHDCLPAATSSPCSKSSSATSRTTVKWSPDRSAMSSSVFLPSAKFSTQSLAMLVGAIPWPPMAPYNPRRPSAGSQ